MVVDERARHRLFRTLEERLGPDEAATLMSLLPPAGWADVATKHDLEELRAATRHDLDDLREELVRLEERMAIRSQALEHRLTATFEAGLRAQVRTFMFFTASFGVSLAGAVIAAAKLL